MNECTVTYDPINTTYTITVDSLQQEITLGHEFFMKHLNDSTLTLKVYSHCGDDKSRSSLKNHLDGLFSEKVRLDELRVKRWKLKNDSKVTISHRRALLIRVQEFYRVFQDMDDDPSSIDEFGSWHLHLEVPKAICEFVREIHSMVDLSDSEEYNAHIGMMLQVQRSTHVQMYIASYFDRIKHMTLGTLGRKSLCDYRTKSNSKCKIIELCNEKDWFWGEGQDIISVINTKNQVHNGTPLLQSCEDLFKELETMMEDVLNGPIKFDGRRTLTLDTGYTNKEALAWKKDALNLTPGLMTGTYRISTRLGRWIGKMGILLTYTLPHFLKTLGKDKNAFQGLKSRRQFQHEFAKEIGLSSEESKSCFQEGNTLALTWSNKLAIHQDTNNCYREGCMFISSASAVIHVDHLSDEAKTKLKQLGCTGKYLHVSNLAYMRYIIGTVAARIEGAMSIHEPAYCHMKFF